MRFIADSSLLVRLYLRDSENESIERFLDEGAKVISLSELARVEVLNVLLRQQDRADQFLADIDEGLRLRLEPVDWPRSFQQAESLARRFSSTLRPGGHDLVLVAAALIMGGTWFLSFDRNSRQRPLAAAAGLRIWPPLSRMIRGWSGTHPTNGPANAKRGQYAIRINEQCRICFRRRSEGYWLGLQQDYDLRRAKRRLGRDLAKIKPCAAAA